MKKWGKGADEESAGGIRNNKYNNNHGTLGVYKNEL